MKIHHFAFLTKDIEKSINDFCRLGFERSSSLISDDLRGIDIVFLKAGSGEVIELVCPNREGSAVNEIIKKQQNSLYHICYKTEDIEVTISELVENGFVLIDAPKPAVAFNGAKVAFLISRYSGIAELVEEL